MIVYTFSKEEGFKVFEKEAFTRPEDYNKGVEALGFSTSYNIKDSADVESPIYTIYHVDPSADQWAPGYEFLLEWSDEDDSAQYILTKNWIDTLQLRLTLAPLITQRYSLQITELLERQGLVASRAFHVNHGHYPDTACAVCDPHTVRLNAEWRARRAEEKAKTILENGGK